MLGELLRQARQTAGLTQDDLAFQAGVDRSYLSELENDKKSPTVKMLYRLCAPLNIKPSQLMAQLERAGYQG